MRLLPFAQPQPMQEIFAQIWSKNVWGDTESRSGGGSNLKQTAFLRPQLQSLLHERGISSMLDIPCGDFHWMKELQFPKSFHYLGADIVPQLIASNQERYGSENFQFQVLNLTSDLLPKVDLIFCRDCLVHLDQDSIFKALSNIRRTNSKWLLMTHFSDRRENRNIKTGQWRPINFTGAPFHLPPPLLMLDEQCTEDGGRYRDKTTSLWSTDQLPA